MTAYAEARTLEAIYNAKASLEINGLATPTGLKLTYFYLVRAVEAIEGKIEHNKYLAVWNDCICSDCKLLAAERDEAEKVSASEGSR